jgi:hypothetical protein
MAKSILYAILFAILGLVLFALVAPFFFDGNLREVGRNSFPIVVIICGPIGYFLGRRAEQATQARRESQRGRGDASPTEPKKETDAREKKDRPYDY